MNHEEFVEEMDEVKDYALYGNEFMKNANRHWLDNMFNSHYCWYLRKYEGILEELDMIKITIKGEINETTIRKNKEEI